MPVWLYTLPLAFHKATVRTVVSEVKSQVAFSISTFTTENAKRIVIKIRIKIQKYFTFSFFYWVLKQIVGRKPE